MNFSKSGALLRFLAKLYEKSCQCPVSRVATFFVLFKSLQKITRDWLNKFQKLRIKSGMPSASTAIKLEKSVKIN